MSMDVADPETVNLYTIEHSNGTWIWKPANYTITPENGTWKITSTFQSEFLEPLVEDILLVIKARDPPVGGIWVPVDKFALLAPYIGLASTILVATAATAIYVKRRKKKR